MEFHSWLDDDDDDDDDNDDDNEADDEDDDDNGDLQSNLHSFSDQIAGIGRTV